MQTLSKNGHTSSFPSEVRVHVADTRADLPTHMLAVYPPSESPAQAPSLNAQSHSKTRVTLLPAHSIVFAAHCAGLPPLPKNIAPRHIPDGSSEAIISLPVVPLCVPSTSTFPLLSAYLYTQRAEQLVFALLGVNPATSQSGPEQQEADGRLVSEDEVIPRMTAQLANAASLLASRHAHEPRILLRKVDTVLGLWRNACVLGVFDTGLWSAIDTAWAVLLTALGVCAGVSNT